MELLPTHFMRFSIDLRKKLCTFALLFLTLIKREMIKMHSITLVNFTYHAVSLGDPMIVIIRHFTCLQHAHPLISNHVSRPQMLISVITTNISNIKNQRKSPFVSDGSSRYPIHEYIKKQYAKFNHYPSARDKYIYNDYSSRKRGR